MKTYKKKSSFLFEHRYAISFFLFLVLYNLLIVNQMHLWEISYISYTYHIVDYSLGFRSRLLPGAVFYGLFGEHASYLTATIYETVLLLLFFAGISFLLEHFICQVVSPYRTTAFVLILFFCSGPYTFAIFTNELGMLDVYWLFFSLLFFVIIEKKVFCYFIPVLFGLSLLVHFSSVISYLILFTAILLYRISLEQEQKKRKTLSFLFLLSVIVTVGVLVFFWLGQAENMPLTREEFHQMLRVRGSKYYLYYDVSFYYIYRDDVEIFPTAFSIQSPVLRAIQIVVERCLFTIRLYFSELNGSILRLVMASLFLIPAMSFIYQQWRRLLKNARGNKLKRFCFSLMMVQFPFTAIVGCLFSNDISRWFTHAFLISFTMLLYVLYHEKEIQIQALECLRTLKNSVCFKLYFAAYFFAHVWAYC